MSPRVRPAALAGAWYPGEPALLRQSVDAMLATAATDAPPPKAMITPHAGHVYSGPIAASAYARLRNRRAPIERVVMLGPAHRVGFVGVATSSADAFETPLGRVPLDRAAIAAIERLPDVFCLDRAHAREHCLEIHLPFLQRTLDAFTCVPLVVGDARPELVARILDALWGGPETLIVISSDLTHFLDYDAARRVDAATSRAIERLRGDEIGREAACGRLPIQGLLQVARRRSLRATTIDLRNSGDTAGSRDRVVGYGAYVFEATSEKGAA